MSDDRERVKLHDNVANVDDGDVNVNGIEMIIDSVDVDCDDDDLDVTTLRAYVELPGMVANGHIGQVPGLFGTGTKSFRRLFSADSPPRQHPVHLTATDEMCGDRYPTGKRRQIEQCCIESGYRLGV